RHFAAAHGETNQREIAQLELGDELLQVLGEGVVIVAGGWLAGPAESAAIIGDDAVAGGQKRRHLLLPGSATEGTSVDEDNRDARAVVLIIEIDISGVFLSDRGVWHVSFSFS